MPSTGSTRPLRSSQLAGAPQVDRDLPPPTNRSFILPSIPPFSYVCVRSQTFGVTWRWLAERGAQLYRSDVAFRRALPSTFDCFRFFLFFNFVFCLFFSSYPFVFSLLFQVYNFFLKVFASRWGTYLRVVRILMCKLSILCAAFDGLIETSVGNSETKFATIVSKMISRWYHSDCWVLSRAVSADALGVTGQQRHSIRIKGEFI